MPESSERFQLMLEALLIGCGRARKELVQQDDLIMMLNAIAAAIKAGE